MADGRPEDPEAAVEDVDEKTLQNLLERTEKTLDYQVETLSDVDDKAIRIYRANVLFLSIVIGGLSIAARNDPIRVAQVINVNSVAGGVLLIGSLTAGAITYRSSDIEAGVTPELIDRTLEDAGDARESYWLVLQEYRSKIADNDPVIERNGRYITYTTIVTIDALTYVAAGVFVTGVVDGSTPYALALAFAAVALPVAVWISKILAYPDCSGRRFLGYASLVVAVPAALTLAQGTVFAGAVEHIWPLVPVFFVGVALAERGTKRIDFGQYFLIVGSTTALTSVLYVSPPWVASATRPLWAAVSPTGLTTLLQAVNRVDVALFVLVGTVLLVVDYRIY